MQGNSLYRIDPPNKNRSAEVVAREILALCHEDFSLTLSDLCRNFCCERQWASETFLHKVRHICLTSFFHRYILSLPGLSEEDQALIAQGLYFFSKKDLSRFWAENASAKRKTVVVGLEHYTRPSVSISSLSEAVGRKRGRAEAVAPLLNDEGRDLVLRVPKWVDVPVPAWDSGFTSVAQLMRRQGLRNNTAAYKYLTEHGAIHIQLGGKVIWHIPGEFWKVPFAVAAEEHF